MPADPRDAALRPKLLDLFCGAGGAAMGYYRAGFDVIGVDIKPQPRYPFPFVQADALNPPFRLEDFDAIHASPPCQKHTTMSNRWRGHGGVTDSHQSFIEPTRELLIRSGLPYVMENVPGAPLRTTLRLHGGMFGLGVSRPRLFETSVVILSPAAIPTINPIGVYGKSPDGRRLFTRADRTMQYAAASLSEAHDAMGMDWADWHGTKEAIPPAYTEFIGKQLIQALQERIA
jgi:DNA (cytosine-5)-methyltransferase 1